MSKKVLLVFHLNFLKRDRGCSNHIYMVARTLKDLGYNLDLFVTDSSEYIDTDFAIYNQKENNLIDNLYYIKNSSALFPNSFCSPNICAEFNKIINTQHYDFINIHYIQWADLIRYADIPEGTELIYTMHDSQFMQNEYTFGDVSQVFVREKDDIALFDKINCISYDEMLFWKHILPEKNFSFLPYTQKQVEHKNVAKKYDLLFLGAGNPYNVEGLIWFLDNVYPKLEKNIKIVVSGKVLEWIKEQYPQKYQFMQDEKFELIDFCENLDELYKNVKIVMVPMLRGTGMKIKTVEALAHGIPIVSTLLGVDGFPDKTLSGILVSDKPEEFATNIMNLLKNEKFYKNVVSSQKQYFEHIFSPKKIEEIVKEIFTLSQNYPARKFPCRENAKEITFQQHKNSLKIILFGFLPLYGKKQKGGKTVYKILGLPLFKIRKMANGITTKYYVFGLPILKMSKK